MKLTIKEVENTSTLYLPESNRCYSVTIKHNKNQETFHIYTGMGWTSIDDDFALRHLFDEANNGDNSYASWARETGYGEQLGYETSHDWYVYCRDIHVRLFNLLGDTLYSELIEQYS